jgi:hypothetical protein
MTSRHDARAEQIAAGTDVGHVVVPDVHVEQWVVGSQEQLDAAFVLAHTRHMYDCPKCGRLALLTPQRPGAALRP